jgi:DNA-binding NtrC family response regulator
MDVAPAAGTAPSISGAILIVDDDPDARELLVDALGRRGFTAQAAATADEALDRLQDGEFDGLVVDVNLDGMSGIELCRRAGETRPNLPSIVMTGSADVEVAIAAMRAGAFDFIEKPISAETLSLMLRRAIEHCRLTSDIARLRGRGAVSKPADLVGDSLAIQRLTRLIDQMAASDATMLVTGESGTGKELIARNIHDRSERARGPFVAVNCGAIAANLLESELFGHVRGAFTDARQGRAGLFARASGGTILLDEIGEMPLEMQAKLLRVLQERKVRAVGSDVETDIDVRVIAATNRDLAKEVAAGRFRADLFYRVNVLRIDVPPLRDRQEDVLALAQHFLARHRGPTRPELRFAPAALRKLLDYDWPGNVRELENCVARVCAMTRGDEIGIDDLPAAVRTTRASRPADVVEDADLITLDEMERRYIRAVLQACRGNKSQAARVLGLDRRALYRRISALHIE